MRICLVSAFPPSRRQLTEYGYHVARELQQNPLVSLTILADELEGAPAELAEFNVRRCWTVDRLLTAPRLLHAIHAVRPDVVWFNLTFSTFGNAAQPVPAFLGLCTPALSRLTGIYTHLTLHHIMEHVSLSDAKVRMQPLYRVASTAATRILLMANSVTVLLPTYRQTLVSKYRKQNIYLRAHGIFSGRPEFPDFSLRGNPEHRILAIGRWGTYKRLELLIEAFQSVRKAVPNATLIIAGRSHQSAPGYWEEIEERHGDNPGLDFRGYVEEADIPELYRSASMLVMPYSSSTGSSGVAHQACQYGVPIVSADLPEFREMADNEGMAIEFYRREDAGSLSHAITRLLQSPEQQKEMAERNFSAALRQSMPDIIRRYLRAFELDQRSKQFLPAPGFRRSRGWATLSRAASADWWPWS